MSRTVQLPAFTMAYSKLPVLLIATMLSSANAATSTKDVQKAESTPAIAGSSFYADKERGWFWYEEPEPEPEPEQPKEEPPAPTPPPQPTEKAEELPPVGSVAWLQIMIPKLKEAAIDDPSEVNVKAFYYAQRLMMDKAERFSRASMQTIKNEPLLDEDLRYPTSNAASSALASAAEVQKKELLKIIANDAALMIFFKGRACALCGQAISALQGLEHAYGFTIIPVSMDGEPLPGGEYQNLQYDAGLAKHLGIITTPAIAMAVPPNDVRIISYSTISLEAASNRILQAASDVGLISKEEMNATSRLAQIGFIGPRQIVDAPADPTKSPEDFVNAMRDAAVRAFDFQNGEDQ